MAQSATISVITIFRFGDPSDVHRTLVSVRSQSISPDALIIVASNATDDQRALIENQFYPNCSIWNLDTGIYNAMNIGLREVNSDLVLFLNGGDQFFDQHCIRDIKALADKNSCHAFRTIQTHGDVKFLRPKKNKLERLRRYPAHQAFVSPIDIDRPILFLEHDFPISADAVWMNENIKTHGIKTHDRILAEFALGGISNWPSIHSVQIRYLENGAKRAVLEAAKLLLSRLLGPNLYFRVLCKRTCDRVYGDSK
ncbi:MAG: glycosyltransferase [Yoonia sp.]